MRFAHITRLFLILGMVLPVSAADWDWKVAPFLWAAGVDGDMVLGPVNSDFSVDFSDIADVLDGGVLLHLEAHQEDKAWLVDFVGLGLEPSGSFSPTGGSTDADLDAIILETAYLLKKPIPSGFRGLEFGLRYQNFDLSLEPFLLPAVKREEGWLDGFVGYRINTEINDDWKFDVRGNMGAGESDFAAELQFNFSYQLKNGDSLAFGYRWLDFDYDTTTPGGATFGLDTSFHGLIIGYVFD